MTDTKLPELPAKWREQANESIAWLNAKFARQGEIEDRIAADLLYALSAIAARQEDGREKWFRDNVDEPRVTAADVEAMLAAHDEVARSPRDMKERRMEAAAFALRDRLVARLSAKGGSQ